MNHFFKFVRRNKGNILVAVLSSIPALLWFREYPTLSRFTSFPVAIVSLGQLAGLVGLALFALAIILSSRLLAFDRFFGGLDRMIKTHHYIGLTGFFMLMAHPTFFVLNLAMNSWQSALYFIFSIADWPTNFGKIALSLLFLLIVITLYGRWRYEILKNIHRLMGVPFLFANFHLLYIPSNVAYNMPLRYYLLGLCAVAWVAYGYRTVFGYWLAHKRKFKVLGVKQLGGDVTEVSMESLSGPFKFKPGQFVLIKFRSENIITQLHPFTISSSNSADDLRLSIKSSGDYTQSMGRLEAGAIAEVEGPYGGFTESLSDADRNIWIAGGIGITPFLSMARSFTNSKLDAKPTLLIHSVVTSDQAIFATELGTTSDKFKWFSFKPYVTENEGFLTAEKVAALSGGLEGADIFLCGPPAMMRSLIQQFKSLGVSAGRIHREEFKLLR